MRYFEELNSSSNDKSRELSELDNKSVVDPLLDFGNSGAVSDEIPKELLILGRFGLRKSEMRAAVSLSRKYGVASGEILVRAGVITPQTWIASQNLLTHEKKLVLGRQIEQKYLLKNAISGLHLSKPEYSAFRTFTTGQLVFLSIAVFVCALTAVFDFRTGLTGLMLFFTGFYGANIIMRGLLIAGYGNLEPQPSLPIEFTTDDLPVYSVLVALYREHGEVPSLCQFLQMLDWPVERLDIKLICEADDRQTIAVIEALKLPAHFELICVPEAAPRTKPKALNYALPLARGDLLVLYDAEDRPSPGQLKEAHARFLSGAPELACLQAPLRIHNGDQNWLCAMFDIEYLTLFNGILPVLASWKVPLPLGGTSNHFKISVLRKVGGWDPYNVTEDADLGVRLAREGYRCETLTSPTWEEAPPRLGVWLKQRTRWIKGWMQTILVHSREPVRFVRDTGLRNSLAFHLLITSLVISVLVHPFFVGLTAFQLANLDGLSVHEFDALMFGASIFNLVGGYSTYAMLSLAVCATLAKPGRMLLLLTLPVYWFLISIAAWRALFHLVIKPHSWEKTPHGLSSPEIRLISNDNRA